MISNSLHIKSTLREAMDWIFLKTKEKNTKRFYRIFPHSKSSFLSNKCSQSGQCSPSALTFFNKTPKMSDSEYGYCSEEFVPVEISPAQASASDKQKKPSGRQTKRKNEDTADKSGKKSKPSKDIFSILSCEERACASKSTPRPPSTFISRVSTGHVRRTANVAGDYLVEVKVYKNADIAGVPTDERYRKVMASLKLECGPNSSEWDLLQQFLGQAYKLFDASEAVFFTYKSFTKKE